MSREEALFAYCLKVGDSSLINGHRLSEWTGHGPVLEQDIALTNIALDHLGQARLLLTYAGQLEGKGKTEDDLAYWRESAEFRNALLCELPNGDFAQTIARQYLFDEFQHTLYTGLSHSADEQLKAIAVKSLKETTYHLRYSREWMPRLGDGTEESRERLLQGLDQIWNYFGDLFAQSPGEDILIEMQIVPDMNALRTEIQGRIAKTFEKATLPEPDFEMYMHEGSQQGIHTEHLSYILTEMQSVTRAHPGATW